MYSDAQRLEDISSIRDAMRQISLEAQAVVELLGGIVKSCGLAPGHAASFSSLPSTNSPFLNSAPALTSATR